MTVDGGSRDTELGRDCRHRVNPLAVGAGFFVHFPGDLHLPGSELGLLASRAPPCPRGGQTVHRPFGHQSMLKLGDRAKDLEEHPTGGGGRVDALVKDDEVNTALLQGVGQVDEVFQRPTEPVELGDDELIACPVGREQGLVEFGSAGELSGGRVEEDLLAAGRGQSIVLGLGVLITG